MAESAHVFLVLEVDIVEVEAKVALGEGREVTEATAEHGGSWRRAGQPEQIKWIIHDGAGLSKFILGTLLNYKD